MSNPFTEVLRRMSHTQSDTFSNTDYEILKRDTLYEGIFSTSRYHLRFKFFSGNWSPIITREIVERPSAVGVLLYDPTIDHIGLIEQFRPGALTNSKNPWLIEIVAGLIGPTEHPNAVARRETQEEAGCEILDLYPITEYFVSPGGSNEYLYLFCGKVDATKMGGVFGLEEECENIRCFTLPAMEAFQMVNEGKVKAASAIIAIQWLQINRERLKKLWQTK